MLRNPPEDVMLVHDCILESNPSLHVIFNHTNMEINASKYLDMKC